MPSPDVKAFSILNLRQLGLYGGTLTLSFWAACCFSCKRPFGVYGHLSLGPSLTTRSGDSDAVVSIYGHHSQELLPGKKAANVDG